MSLSCGSDFVDGQSDHDVDSEWMHIGTEEEEEEDEDWEAIEEHMCLAKKDQTEKKADQNEEDWYDVAGHCYQ